MQHLASKGKRRKLNQFQDGRVVMASDFTNSLGELCDRGAYFIMQLFRHGDRSPLFIYPNDPNRLDCWPEGLGKLTRLGKKQHYAVGKFLRSMYKDFVTSNPVEVSAISSATERTLSSAQVNLAAFYAPEGRWKFEEKLNWQPIPVYTIPTKYDKYLSFNSICPRAEEVYLERIKAFKKTKEFRKHQRMLKTVSHYAGFDISQGINVFGLFDILMGEKIHNLTFPEWANTYWDELEEIADIYFHYILNSPVFLKLRLGPLFQKITETMTKKIDGDTPDLKLQVYSAHDVNVAGALMVLNFTDMPLPPYCATLLFELHEMPDATRAVRLLYLNSTDPLKEIGKPHVLVLDACSEFCPIEIFIKKIKHWVPDNWELECQIDASNPCETDKTFDNVRPGVRPEHKIDAVLGIDEL
ncbi:unnamed protein product [Larinioides sclopetarius]|uniref:acid phosphatase n=1 Tax=Larinioides sclopetarius TaxID=280406 RepID=A0AAV2A9A2_9ARAC